MEISLGEKPGRCGVTSVRGKREKWGKVAILQVLQRQIPFGVRTTVFEVSREGYYL